MDLSHDVAEIARDRTTCRLHLGRSDGVTYIGWSTSLQSSFGVSYQFLDQLSETVDALLEDRSAALRPAPVEQARPRSVATGDQRYLPLGLTVTSKCELREVLAGWLRHSDAPTIGDTGDFGGRAWISVQLSCGIADLNTDTTRTAVARYLDEVRRKGAELTWHVMPTRTGVIRKVVYSDDPADSTGWNCYLRRPLPRPAQV